MLKSALLSVLTLLASQALAMDDGTKCSNKNPNVVNAIGKFCQNQTIFVPSEYATNGMWSDNVSANVQIKGDCNPPQFVPAGICLVSPMTGVW